MTINCPSINSCQHFLSRLSSLYDLYDIFTEIMGLGIKCQTHVVGYTVSTYKRIRMFEPGNKDHVVARLADDLVEMHSVGAIELEYWETARLLVEQYYNVFTKVMIGDKK